MAFNSLIDRTGADALVPEEVASEIIQAVPQASAARRLFRPATMSRNQKRLPCMSTFPTAYWVSGDTGQKQTTSQSWANKYLDAEELAVIVPIPEAVLSDTDYDIWGEVKPRIVEAFGAAIDAAVLFGTNKPSSWPNDILAAATAASQTVTHGSLADIAEELGGESGIMKLVEADGFDVNGFVADISVKAKLRGLRTEQGAFIFQPSMTAGTPSTLYGQPLEFPMNGGFDATQALVLCGDWKQAMLAIRQDLTYKLLTEAVIQDGAGNIIYNLAQQDMVALRAVMRVAYQVANPITKMAQTEATRYPFSALLPVA